MRFQEHYESPRFRGKIFSFEEFRSWYITKRDGKFTYYGDWAGFNIPSHILKTFREGKFNPLSREEQRLLDLLTGIPEPFYVVGAYGKKMDLPVLKHELVHGLFYTVPGYRKKVLRTIKIRMVKSLAQTLKKVGYHPSVWLDEVNAYLIIGAEVLLKEGFEWNTTSRKLREKLRETFRQHFGFSLLNANEAKILSYFQVKELVY